MEDKRARILKSALELFVNQGFHATPTALIASKAGVANGTLFHYFKTKEELINILYLETKELFFRTITKEWNSFNTLKVKMNSIWKNAIYWALANKNEFKFLQQFSNSPFISQITHNQILSNHEALVKQINIGVHVRKLKDLPIQLILQLAVYQIYGVITYLMENDELKDKEKLIDKTFDCLWDSLSIK